MTEWVERSEQYLNEMLKLEVGDMPRVCRVCNSAGESYRCLSCHGQEPLCAAHMESTHKLLPFHRIEKWDGTSYRSAWLKDVGLVLHLGHGGRPCDAGIVPEEKEEDVEEEDGNDDDGEPSMQDLLRDESIEADTSGGLASSPKLSWVVDTSGIHPLPISYCTCQDVPRDIQLVRMRLWPASFDRIKTVFTFRVLADFRMDNLESKTTAYHYYRKLRRVTNPHFPDQVKVSFRGLR